MTKQDTERPADLPAYQRERYGRELHAATLMLSDLAERLGFDPRAVQAHELSTAVGRLRVDLGLA